MWKQVLYLLLSFQFQGILKREDSAMIINRRGHQAMLKEASSFPCNKALTFCHLFLIFDLFLDTQI